MAPKEEFDVLRLIEHGQTCYVSSDNVRGVQLAVWLRSHSDMSKEMLFGWIQDIARQLSLIHKCRGRPCYQYVNPYSLIVTEEKGIYFLDTGAGSNEEVIREMQRRPVREHFLPPEEPYYQRASEELDIYGLGKTIQFLLAETQVDPPLSRIEEKKFQIILSKCLEIHSRKAFTQVSDILKNLPRYRQKIPKRNKKKTEEGSSRRRDLSRFLIPAGLSVVVSAVIMAVLVLLLNIGPGRDVKEAVEVTQAAGEFFESARAEPQPETGRTAPEETASAQTAEAEEADPAGRTVTEGTAAPEASMTEEARLNLKLGALYFLELGEYDTSRTYFLAAGPLSLAQNMAAVCAYLSEGGDETEQTQIRQALQRAEEALQTLDSADAVDFYFCFLKTYLYMDADEDTKEILRLGEQCLETARTDQQGWILEGMAAAYEKQGDWQEAADTCCDWLLVETDGRMRELIFERMAGFLEEAGHARQAREKLLKGVKEFPQSVNLRLRYLQLLCQDTTVDRGRCAEEISACIKELPEVKEEEVFTKLLKENGMKMEGEKVWAER